MPIPVANIYYLLCYAWDQFAPRQMAGVEVEKFQDTLHLFAHLLVVGLRTLHRRGPETGYVVTEEPTSTLRGRLLIGRSLQLLARHPLKLVCAFDEMNADILSNQILKAIMHRILGEQNLQANQRAEVRRAAAAWGCERHRVECAIVP
jgi:5-methylcytosine-specific restriction enzyme subunit McrC